VLPFRSSSLPRQSRALTSLARFTPVPPQHTQEESDFYKRVQADSIEQLKRDTGDGGKGSYINMLHMLLKLRQACNHPWLVKGGGYQGKQLASTGTGAEDCDKVGER
jgi:SNF2 family DNA or RNA helicase